MTALFRVKQAAIITQLQDLGRFGQMDIGFSQSGPMDDAAFAANNRLLGNAENAAQLEIAPGGLALEVLAETTLAIAGAYAMPTLDGKPLVNFHSYTAHAGQELRFGFAKHGQYCYLAVKNGFAGEALLNSLSTCARLQIFPLQISKNTLLCGTPETAANQGLARKEIPDYLNHELFVLPSYQYAQFSAETRARFTSQDYRIVTSDRMGTLLEAGQPLSYDGGELLSEGIVPGSIQLTHAGQPIVLQKDAQTIGGYPKIGVLTPESRSRLAQHRAGERVKFTFLDDAEN